MANSIALTEKYLPILDEVYKAESKTAILDATGARVQFDGTPTVKLFKTSMQGLGDYSRNTGFVSGDVTGTWESHTLSQDRGRGFMVDSMDDEETLGLAFGTLAGEFLRTQVVPEIDAYTFAKLAGTSNITVGTAADLSSSSDVPALISEAEYGRKSIAGIIKNYFDDSYLSAVSSFVKEEKISVEELRELINQIENQQS